MNSPHANRSRARARAVQFLFGRDFTSYDPEDALEPFWELNPTRKSVKHYAEKLIRGVWTHMGELDEAINGALDHWTPGRVGRIEQNVIRVALFEILYCDDVPPSVAINEAIEVCRQFGGEEAPRFVNGVLDRLKRQLKPERQEHTGEHAAGRG
jgi:N utilization substance protein B